MTKYISNIQRNPTHKETVNFPGKQLNEGLSGLGNKTVKTKFVLFNNIRLDFDQTGKNVKDDKEVQNKNLINAYINSVNFANKINPLGNKSGFGRSSFGKRISTKELLRLIKYLKKSK